jgi:hypothetical protein
MMKAGDGVKMKKRRRNEEENSWRKQYDDEEKLDELKENEKMAKKENEKRYRESIMTAEEICIEEMWRKYENDEALKKREETLLYEREAINERNILKKAVYSKRETVSMWLSFTLSQI